MKFKGRLHVEALFFVLVRDAVKLLRVRTDQRRGVNNLPTEVPITLGHSSGGLAGDGMGPIYVSLDSPFTRQSNGSFEIDRLGTSNVAQLVVNGQINPQLAANNIQVIKETHGKT